MNIFSNSIPVWISALLFVSFSIPIIRLVQLVKQGTLGSDFDPKGNNNLPRSVAVFFLLYFFYVSIMSFTGVFQVNTLPPRILLFTAIPLLLFYFIFVFRTRVFWQILENVQLSNLVRFHTFRFVGFFFILGWIYGVLPKSFALIGGIGDIFVGLTAIIVASLIDKKSKNYQKITLIWNIIGFWDIVSVIVSAIYVTKLALDTQTDGILEMTKFPFCFIPAFAPATIIFIHICIFKKLKMSK